MRLNDSGRFFSQLMYPLRAGREGKLFSAYLGMINHIDSVAPVQGLCHRRTQLILMGILKNRLNRETKDSLLLVQSLWGTDAGQGGMEGFILRSSQTSTNAQISGALLNMT